MGLLIGITINTISLFLVLLIQTQNSSYGFTNSWFRPILLEFACHSYLDWNYLLDCKVGQMAEKAESVKSTVHPRSVTLSKQ